MLHAGEDSDDSFDGEEDVGADGRDSRDVPPSYKVGE
jgi:hypothetical protein